MIKGEPEPPAQEDEFSLWLAAYDERLATGASVASLDEVGRLRRCDRGWRRRRPGVNWSARSGLESAVQIRIQQRPCLRMKRGLKNHDRSSWPILWCGMSSAGARSGSSTWLMIPACDARWCLKCRGPRSW